MTVTAGKLRALTQPIIVLRMDKSVNEAPGERDQTVFADGIYVYAQYIGNGRLLLTPIGNPGWGSHVVMASALNSTSTVVENDEVARALRIK